MFDFFKKVVNLESDKDYWDKKATKLEYLSKQFNEVKKGNNIENINTNNELLYEQAVISVGNISFEEEIKRLNIKKYYIDLDKDLIMIAVGIGVTGALSGLFIDSLDTNKKEIFIKEQLNVKKNHPSDFYMGNKHRYVYGHDILNPFQKLPEGYNLPKNMFYEGENVGGKTLYSLIEQQYFSGTKNPFFKIFQSFLGHLASDIVTKDGIPFPGSSYFTKWDTNLLNSTGYSPKNEVMNKLGRELGTISESDFVSIIIMKIMTEVYLSLYFKNKNLPENSKDIFRSQFKLISISTTIISQLTLIMVNGGNKNSIISNSKFNLILVGLFLKHFFSLQSKLSNENKKVHDIYDRSIKLLKNEDTSIEDWVKNL